MIFNELEIKAGILRGIEQMGYVKATEIQDLTIKHALEGKNIVGQSQTGSGKTAAFLIPMLNSIDTNKKGLQAVILAPTRELVVQILQEIYDLTKFYRVNAISIFGGASINVQKKNLLKNPTIIVATPGRLLDLIDQKAVSLYPTNFFVLDEVDRMLDMGFIKDIKKIRDKMPNIKQTFTFSATINDAMLKIIKEHIDTYEFIKVGEQVTVDKIDHGYINSSHDDKFPMLLKILEKNQNQKIVIFTQTKRNTTVISKVLEKEKYNAGCLNGDMSQNKRLASLNAFKAGKTDIMVTTDVAARGLNMDNVGLVINFDVPVDTESYIHRIGRTGRAGAEGKAITLVCSDEQSQISNIERSQKIRISRLDTYEIDPRKGFYGELRMDKFGDKKGGRGRSGSNNGGRSGGRDGSRFGSNNTGRTGGKPGSDNWGKTGLKSGKNNGSRFGEIDNGKSGSWKDQKNQLNEFKSTPRFKSDVWGEYGNTKTSDGGKKRNNDRQQKQRNTDSRENSKNNNKSSFKENNGSFRKNNTKSFDKRQSDGKRSTSRPTSRHK